jgi:hypothetical protein
MHDARSLGLALALGLVPGLACDAPPPHRLVAGVDPAFPRLRFEDGSVSLNDRCPVTLSRLNPRLDPVQVNGRSIGFC